jgi:ABC-type antimicrobial peptide transport system permease subunit
MMCIIIAFIFLFCNFSNSIIAQEEKLDLIYKEIPIYVEVSDYKGNNRTKLALPDGYYVETFTKDEYKLSKYLKDVCLRRELDVLSYKEKEIGIDSLKLIGVTNIKYEEDLRREKGLKFEIEFQEGFDYDIFKETSNLCLVSEELLAKMDKKLGDIITFSAMTETSVHTYKNEEGYAIKSPVDVRLSIAGVIKDANINEIFCSWKKIAEYGAVSDNGSTLYTDILRATINDNYKLNEFKKDAITYYVSTGSRIFTGTRLYGLTVYDDSFIKAVLQIRRNIKFLKAIYPLVIIFSFVIGYLVSFLFTRNRKKEVAIMRSLGTSKFRVFVTIMMELFTINVVGTIIGMLVCNYILKIKVTINEIALFFVFNILGAALSTIRISSGIVMSIMKDKE